MGAKKSKLKRGLKYENDTTGDIRTSQTGLTEVKAFEQIHEDRVSCVAAYKSSICVSGSTDTVRDCLFLCTLAGVFFTR